jgi:hypothetical protein
MEQQKEQTQRTLTKQKRVRSNYLMTQRELNLFIAAAHAAGESRSEFLRQAVRARALRILGHVEQQ